MALNSTGADRRDSVEYDSSLLGHNPSSRWNNKILNHGTPNGSKRPPKTLDVRMIAFVINNKILFDNEHKVKLLYF